MENLKEVLKTLEEKRRNREITAKDFYFELLNLLSMLKEILSKEKIDEQALRRQIPLLLTFLKSQIKRLHENEKKSN